MDTTGDRLHLVLAEPGQAGRTWRRCVEAVPGRSHSVTLLPTLDELLAQAGAKADALTGVVVCVGPGGFTALRIGVATAEGLALTGLPTWGFSAFALRARALRLNGCQEPIWIIMDGQRQEAFIQRWGAQALAPAAKCALTDLEARVGDGPWWAPAAFRARAAAHLAAPCLTLEGLEDEGAATLAGLAALCRELPAKPPEAPLAPFYLRETDAEVNFPQASLHLSEAHRRGQAR
jgi:tRNA threonylcarbamoyladenosine biosynthesis protein TsaB